jgi:anti-sigma regulatory factor (Ser/Thr protein kinase)
MKHSSSLPAVKESVTEARDFVMRAIGAVPSAARDAVMVVTSELTSNSVRHGASSFEVTIEQFPDRIVIEVHDDGDGEPVMRFPGPTDTSGRGLQITRALAETWGVRRDPGAAGKTVWAVVRIPAGGAVQPAPEAAVRPAPGSPPARTMSRATDSSPSRSLGGTLRTICLGTRRAPSVPRVLPTIA